MSDKVVWLEGMALSPQHFQLAEQATNSDTSQRLQILSPFFFGLASLEIEISALENGIFSIQECSGVFPDHTPFAFPKYDSYLEQRLFETFFTAQKESLSVFLGLPSYAEGAVNYASFGIEGRPTRLRSFTREVSDVNTGINPRRVELGQLSLRVLFEGEVIDGYQTIKLAELVRDPQGKVILNSKFISPVLRLGASTNLTTRLRRLVETCIQKSNFLMGQRAQKSSGVARFSAESITNYLLLSAINSHLPELIHCHTHPAYHGEYLYRKLASFAGALLSFGSDSKIADLPKYAHGDLSNTFLPLFHLIDTLLNATVPTGYINFPLIKTSPIQYTGNMRDTDLSSLGEFYLSVSAQASEVDILNLVQRHAKVGPPSQLATIVNAALPGIALVPEASPPQAIPSKSGHKYFRLQRSGELWDQVLQSKAIAIHLPSSLPGTKLELAAVQE